MPDSQWHCATCDTITQLSDARVREQKFACAHRRGCVRDTTGTLTADDGEVCGGGLERVTVELAEKLAAEKRVRELMQDAPKPAPKQDASKSPTPATPSGFCETCGWSTEARLAAVLARDRAELRDKFACAALPGLLARDDGHTVSMVTRIAYSIADAMIEVRDRNDDG